jgi:hypothetical protein
MSESGFVGFAGLSRFYHNLNPVNPANPTNPDSDFLPKRKIPLTQITHHRSYNIDYHFRRCSPQTDYFY